jgi:5'-3' exonuclease
MSGTRLRSNPIGESIYNKIQDYDNMARKVFLATLPAEHKDLYNKYRIARNVANHKSRDDNLEKANKQAKAGMQRLRATRTKEEIAEQRKVWDKTYYEKLRAKSALKIQKVAREYIAKKKANATKTANSMVNDLFKEVLDKIPAKRKVGRPRKPRNPVGRPKGSKNKK